jgi:hypothetical protein
VQASLVTGQARSTREAHRKPYRLSSTKIVARLEYGQAPRGKFGQDAGGAPALGAGEIDAGAFKVAQPRYFFFDFSPAI